MGETQQASCFGAAFGGFIVGAIVAMAIFGVNYVKNKKWATKLMELIGRLAN